jgi:HlyD family secretion protein
MATPSGRRRARLAWILGIGAALLVIALAGAWFLTRPAPAKKAEFDTLTVARTTQTDTVTLSGTIHPQSQANAAFKVPGTVNQIRVKVGDTVAKGDTLASVDTQDLSDAVALADANAAAARAQLTTVQDSSSATDAQLRAAEAQVRSAEASLTNAKNRLADATLVSPIAGTIAKVGYSVGDQVAGTGSSSGSAASSGGLSGLGGISLSGAAAASGTTTGAIVVISTDAWQLDASVGTADLTALKQGQDAIVTPTGTSTSVHGTVDTVGIVAAQNAGATATFPVTIKVTDAGAKLFSGSSADAVVTTGTFSEVLTVPMSAVTTYNGASSVNVVTGTSTVVRAVTLGRHFGSAVEILSGLTAGENIQAPKAVVVTTSAPPAIFGRTASPSATPSK